MSEKLRKHNSKVKVEVITWPDIASENSFGTIKAISDQGTIDFIQKVGEKVGSKKLRATYLDPKLTAYQYSSVTSTYPLGCYKCTALNHTKECCPVEYNKKRQASRDLDEHPTKVLATGTINKED